MQVGFPDLPALVESNSVDLISYLQSLADIDQSLSVLEQRSAARLLAKRITLYPDVRARLRRLVSEPSVTLDSYLCLAPPFDVGQEWTDGFVSACVGREMSTRSTPVRSTPDRHGICAVFPRAADVVNWFQRLNSLHDNRSYDAVSLAAAVYAYVCLMHPYDDGNGRLARALALRALRDRLSLPGLHLALGPSFTFARGNIVRELRRLSVTADWPHYIAFFKRLLCHAAMSTAKLSKP